MSGTKGSVALSSPAETIDVVGYGASQINEFSPTSQLSNSTSASRDELGSDTDNNAADFTVGTPTPTNSANDSEGGGSTDPEQPQPPVDPGEVIAIADIQGTGATSPHEGRTVTTQGEVTAVYAEGGLNGLLFQPRVRGPRCHRQAKLPTASLST